MSWTFDGLEQFARKPATPLLGIGSVSSRRRATKHFGSDETIFAMDAAAAKQAGSISAIDTGSRAAEIEWKRHSMRTMSLILACAFLFAGASVAGSSEGSLPGIGTFTYLDAVLPDGPSAPDTSLACAAQ